MSSRSDVNVASVEIMWRGESQRRFVQVPSLSCHLPEATQSNFVEFVDRSSHENKSSDLCQRSKIISIELLLPHRDAKLSRENQNRATWLTFALAA